MRKERRLKKGRRKKIVITILSILGVLILAAGVFAYQIYSSVEKAADDMFHAVGSEANEGPSAVDANDDGDPDPISILLMGVDQRKNDVGRSDTLIVLTLNPADKTMQMVSIPRDTRTLIVGRGTQDKINHAYAFGGVEMSINTVEHFLNLDLDYYIKMDMQGLVALVDAVGGITLYNDDSWHDPGYYKKGYFYHEGTLHLNGPQAIGFVRMRYLPGGDFTRNEHQREVIEAIVDKAASFSSITRYQDILNAISDHIQTNISFDEMKYIALHYREARTHVKTYEVKGNGTKIDGIYYLVVDKAERQKVHDMIAGQLQEED
ncbi:MAG TPA: LCP family protein [Bacillales bacterium]|nr:LCP family protein [Bacillales bacterium]